jgi:hypothetical protein
LYNTLQKILREDCHHSLMKSLRNLLLLYGLLFLAACLPVNSTLATPISLPTETATPSPTIVWFPASATPTLLTVPTYTGTPEMSPGIGKVILRDDFSEDDIWDTASSANGSATINSNRLTLAVQPGYYLSSMRREMTLTDFYAEITARPSLCRGEDNYGLIVRGVGTYFYRFTLTCNHEIRAERVNGGTKLTLHEAVPSGDAPGAPGEVRIGVWAVENEMRLFLNGRYQFTVSDPSFPSGALGVYVRSTGDTPVTVIFSELEVREIGYVLPTKTPLTPLP